MNSGLKHIFMKETNTVVANGLLIQKEQIADQFPIKQFPRQYPQHKSAIYSFLYSSQVDWSAVDEL